MIDRAMRLKDIKTAMHESPFKPFRLKMADGSLYVINHPDFIAIPPEGRTITVYGDGEDNYAHIDCYLIESIEYGDISQQPSSN